ncbi:MAG: hypothetical protein H6621_10380 [Halobacteriovoraceae bacterium]|nr:hypothetical protein [Halobacteriovoraceae bacterium]MCB9095462.1 hypothetical protein [Halobacteriovoraceae bacterium]
MIETDYNKLVDETFRLDLESEEASIESLENFPESAGVFYRFENKSYCDILRCTDSTNIRTDIGLMQESGTIDLASIKYFETADLKSAQLICREFDKFRFHKQDMLSLSDVSLNNVWVLEVKEDSVVLNFDSQSEKNSLEKMELGALGDSSLAKYYFSFVEEIFKDDLGILETKTTKRTFKWKFKNERVAQEFFNKLKEFSTELLGEKELSDDLQAVKVESLQTFFAEKKILRDFWSDISTRENPLS